MTSRRKQRDNSLMFKKQNYIRFRFSMDNTFFSTHSAIANSSVYELEDCLGVLRTDSTYGQDKCAAGIERSCDEKLDGERDILDCQITQNNAQMIVRGVKEYFRMSGGSETKLMGLFSFRRWAGLEKSRQTLAFQRALAYDTFIHEEKKQLLLDQCQKYEVLKFLLAEICEKTEERLFSELLLMVVAVLKAKMTSFEALNGQELEEVPRMVRFWGDEGEETQLLGGWQMDAELQDGAITSMAKRGIEGISAQAVVADNLQLLTFNSSPSEVVHQNLSSLFGFISETIFFTLNGSSQSLQNCQLYISELQGCQGKKKIKTL